MSNYEINLQIDIGKTESEITKGATQSGDGCFRMVMSGESGRSIDQCEHALLAVNYPAIREALSRHCSEVSRQAAAAYGPGV